MWSIPVTVITRFGPWFGRIAKASPALLANLVNKLKASGAVVGSSAVDVANFVKTSPVNAVLVFTTLASLGASVADLFTAEEKSNPETREIVRSLTFSEMSVTDATRAAAHSEIIKIAAMSESLQTGVSSNEVQLATAAEILGWASRFFGGPSAARAAHGKMQAFFEMSLADVEAGFRRLKL